MASDVVGGRWVEPIARRRGLGTHGREGERGMVRGDPKGRRERTRCV